MLQYLTNITSIALVILFLANVIQENKQQVNNIDSVKVQQSKLIETAEKDIKFQNLIKNIVNTKDTTESLNKKEMICLAKNIFFEARGTDEMEQIKVANVTTNRVKSGKFQKSYCSVIYAPYQFSWTITPKKHNVMNFIKAHTIEYKAWKLAKKIATHELTVGFKDYTRGALFYHTRTVSPKWSKHKSIKRILATNWHIYYKHNEIN